MFPVQYLTLRLFIKPNHCLIVIEYSLSYKNNY